MGRKARQPKAADGENPFMRPGVMDHVAAVLSMLISQETGEEIIITYEKKKKDEIIEV